MQNALVSWVDCIVDSNEFKSAVHVAANVIGLQSAPQYRSTCVGVPGRATRVTRSLFGLEYTPREYTARILCVAALHATNTV